MDSLQKLRKEISALLEASKDKEQIDSLSGLNAVIDEVEADTKALIDKNSELLTDYKNAVLHSSYKDPGKSTPNTTESLSFEDSLRKFASELKK